jgi:hypothetical protein
MKIRLEMVQGLKIGVDSYMKQLVKELQADYKLSDYEALDIALKIQQNAVLKAGLVVSTNKDEPTALESIAMHLGQG